MENFYNNYFEVDSSTPIDFNYDAALDFRDISDDLGVEVPTKFDVECEANKVVILIDSESDSFEQNNLCLSSNDENIIDQKINNSDNVYNYLSCGIIENSFPATASSSIFSNSYFNEENSIQSSKGSLSTAFPNNFSSSNSNCFADPKKLQKNVECVRCKEIKQNRNCSKPNLTPQSFPFSKSQSPVVESSKIYVEYEPSNTKRPFDCHSENNSLLCETSPKRRQASVVRRLAIETNRKENFGPSNKRYLEVSIVFPNSLLFDEKKSKLEQFNKYIKSPSPNAYQHINSNSKFQPPQLIYEKQENQIKYFQRIKTHEIDGSSAIPHIEELKNSLKQLFGKTNNMYSNSRLLNSSTEFSTDPLISPVITKKKPLSFMIGDYKEELIKQGFTKDAVCRHRLENLDKYCVTCKRKFRNYWDFAGHFQNLRCRNNAPSREYLCVVDSCPLSIIGFIRKLCLRHHCHNSHFRNLYVADDYKQWELPLQKLSFCCSYCGKCFYRRDSLVRHENSLHSPEAGTMSRKKRKALSRLSQRKHDSRKAFKKK